MQKKMLRILLLLVFLALNGIVVSCGPRFETSEEAKQKLRELPGQIEIKLVGSGKSWLCSISKGTISCNSVINTAGAYLEARPFIYLPKEAPRHLPKIAGFEYHGPYTTSPDKSFSVYAISTATEGSSSATDIVLIRSQENTIVSRGKSKKTLDLLYVDDIVCSPDSNMFAVLHSSSRLSLGFKGIIGIMFAHPIYVNSFYLSIYDRNGKLLVWTDVASQLVRGGGQVSWIDR